MESVIREYANKIGELCQSLDVGGVDRAVALLKKAYDENRRIFVAGNGGSAGTANHFSCDFSKNAVKHSNRRPKVYTLSSNTEYITAIGNDITFEGIFSEQLKNLFEEGDVLIAVSASGNSPDIVSAVEYVKEHNGSVIGLSGFQGGKLGKMSDVSINVPSDSYELSEDIHSVILHSIVCAFKAMNL